jgi:hypothetical protein
MTYSTAIPLQPFHARKIVLELFNEKPQWSREELSKEVIRRHENSGGVTGIQSPTMVVKKCLSLLRQEGRVTPVAKGIWISIDPSSIIEATGAIDQSQPIATTKLISDDSIDADDEDEEFQAKSEQLTIGQGEEAVYLYFNPNDRELAKFRGSDCWECKIGRTKHLPVDTRIFSQGIKTALSKMPVIGLVILTENCVLTERAIHTALSNLSLEAPDSPGMEWFITNPKRVADWYLSYLENLNIFSQSPSKIDS